MVRGIVGVLALAAGCGRVDFENHLDARALAADTASDAVPQLGCVAQLATVGFGLCVRRSDGHVLCWGHGSRGELAQGVVGDSPLPLATPVTDAISLFAGENTVCAVRADHSLLCWGANDLGQVGDGTGADQLSPVPISLPAGVAEARIGEYHACARLLDGSGMCWGDNSMGELNQPLSGPYLSPTPAPALSSATQLSVSDMTTCALASNGTVSCFGVGDNGDLGDGGMTTRYTAAPVSIPDPVIDITGGCHRHTCAVTNKNEAWCWGQNSRGELGTTPTTFEVLPVKVPGIPPVAEIGVGAFHTCARTTTDEIWCWGDGTAGALGDGTTNPAAPPHRITAFTGTPLQLQASCGATHVRRNDGTLVGWGGKDVVGSNPSTDALLPTDIDIPCP